MRSRWDCCVAAEIDKTLKKVAEGIAVVEDMWHTVSPVFCFALLCKRPVLFGRLVVSWDGILHLDRVPGFLRQSLSFCVWRCYARYAVGAVF
jgi:hypothetical protein